MPNHPPAPVLESVSVVVRTHQECEEIKAKYGIDSGTHGTNPSKSGKQSHHILQNAAMKNSNGNRIISTYSGYAVMLQGGSHVPGSEHYIANIRQAARTRKGTKNPNPTFGDLKKYAKADLAAAFQHGKPSRGMSNKEAEIYADCLTLQAEKDLENYRRKNNLRPAKLKDSNRTRAPRGCFSAGTLIWLSSGRWINVEDLTNVCLVENRSGTKRVIRTGDCINELIGIRLGGTSIQIAPFHRLRLSCGKYICADALRRGHELDTKFGPRTIDTTCRIEGSNPVYHFGMGKRTECCIGEMGVWVEVPVSGPEIINSISLTEK